ncbi:MAG: undecaprenyl/decaprenyl-phosphate alpha-N-acetylglucosaminyl 1-phosphate transferase [Bacteroidaceae bacterium]|nr:undecaprenyl/decaprenyl-phosphate alpha-N-acetylglucosaminyl 1-phosphate transferase [Bacteroidaceae bacterium]
MNSILFLILAFAFSACLTAVIIPKIILISYKKNLFDVVDERKVHTGVVPRLGGVAFTPSLIMSMALVFGVHVLLNGKSGISTGQAAQLSLSLCALMLLYIEGISDDLIGVGYKAKFACQLLAAMMIVVSGIWINDFNGFLGISEVAWYIGMPFTVVLVVFIINAINLIDGIDGLASGLSIVALFFLGALLFSRGDVIPSIISFAMLGTLLPFFAYNVFGKAERQKKIFMGDCGSQTVGLVLGMLAVRYSMTDASFESDMPNVLVLAFSAIMIPSLDVLRVMIGRIRRGYNPFLPDKTHIHHKFLALGMSHRTAMVTILMLDAFFMLLNLGLVNILNINIVLAVDIILWTVMHLWISKVVKIRKLKLSE